MASHEPGQSSAAPFLYFDNLAAWHVELPQAEIALPLHQPTPQPAPDQGNRARSTPALLYIILVLGIGAVAIAWSAVPAHRRPWSQLGFDLRVATLVPKVNKTSAEACALPPPSPKTEKTQPRPQVAANLVALESGPWVSPPAVEVKSQAVEDSNTLVPVVFYGPGTLACSCFRDPHQGESPMLRNWKTVKLASVVAVAVALTPAPAAAQANDLKNLKDSFDAMQKQMEAQQRQIDTKLEKMTSEILSSFSGVSADLNKIKGDLKSLSDMSDANKLKVEMMDGALKLLESRMTAMKADMDKLQNRDPSQYPADKAGVEDFKQRLAEMEAMLRKLNDGRISNSLPAYVGRIQLVNMYPEEMLFVINNKNYRVAPNATMTLESQPVGTFLYEVISGTYGLRGTNRPMLEAGKTYTITVR